MLRIGVLVSGGGTNLQAVIDSVNSGFIKAEIATVVSSKNGARALERAKLAGIDTVCICKKDYKNQYDFEDALISNFKHHGVELIILAGFTVVLSEKFINVYRNRIINVHPSLIPSFCGAGYYGLKVHEAVLSRGVKVTGATVHFVNEETDGGPIILQKAVYVEDDDTPETLQKRVMKEAEWIILPKAVKLFCEDRLVIENNIVRVNL